MPSARTDPYKNFNFRVEIDGVAAGQFAEVSGLAAEAEVVEYREGADKVTSSRKLPGRVRYPNVTLRRGLTGSRDLWEWWKTVRDGAVERRTVVITLLSDAGEPLLRWVLRNAWIAKIEAPDLNAEGNDVAIESVELAHEGLELDD
jgi:phage tail-like protein